MSLPDPVLRYSFDSVSNLGTDLSVNGHDATVSNVTIVSDATYGDVADFDGSGSIEPNTIPSALVGGAARTISIWVNMDANGNNGAVFSQSNAAGTGNLLRILIGRSGNEVRFENSWNNQLYTQSLSNGVWYHLVLSFDGTVSSTYFQGSQLGSALLASISMARWQIFVYMTRVCLPHRLTLFSRKGPSRGFH